HVEAIRAETRHHAIIVDESVVAAEYPVARAPDTEIGPTVDVQSIHEFGGIRTDDFDLAQSRRIENAAGVAHREALARDGCMHSFTGPREIPRALPEADVLENGAFRRRPFVRGRRTQRIEQIAARDAGENTETHRRVGHSKGRVAHLREGAVELLRHDRHRVEIRRLALIGGHTGGGVALDVFYRLE